MAPLSTWVAMFSASDEGELESALSACPQHDMVEDVDKMVQGLQAAYANLPPQTTPLDKLFKAVRAAESAHFLCSDGCYSC